MSLVANVSFSFLKMGRRVGWRAWHAMCPRWPYAGQPGNRRAEARFPAARLEDQSFAFEASASPARARLSTHSW